MALKNKLWNFSVGKENVLLMETELNGRRRLVPIKDFGGEQIDGGGWFISEALIKKYIENNLEDK